MCAVVGAAVAGYQALGPEPVYSRHVPITTKIVFNREIAQIFQKKCFQCHTDGNVSVPLTTYREARPWAVAIKEEILEKRMPPWGAASGYGHFSNDMSLTGREISLILSWADGGAPSGVLLADEDKPPVFVPSLTGWEQGPPDAVVSGRRESEDRRRFAVPRRAIRSQHRTEAGALAARAAAQSVRSPRHSLRGDLRRAQRPMARHVDAVEQGQRDARRRRHAAAGRRQAHRRDRLSRRHRKRRRATASSVCISRRSRRRRPSPSIEIAPAPVNVAAGQERRTHPRRNGAQDARPTIAALWPRLGAGARSIEVTAIRADGSVEPMLWVNNYRAEWPAPYILKDPITLPAGTRLVMTAYYDNTTDAAIAAKPSLSVTALPPSRPSRNTRTVNGTVDSVLLRWNCSQMR